MPVGAAEAGSWGGGGGTGRISAEGLGACGGPSSAEVGGPGVVAVFGGGLVVLAGAESVGGGVKEEGERRQVREVKKGGSRVPTVSCRTPGCSD